MTEVISRPLKIANDAVSALDGLGDNMTVMLGGFGLAGSPLDLIDALTKRGLHDLTVISNNAGNGDRGLAALVASGAVRKLVCSFPRFSEPFEKLYRKGEIELELVPQGTLSERIRAGGAGIGGFFTPTGVGTPLVDGKEIRTIDGREYVLEWPLKADFTLIHARSADPLGNLVYSKSSRNYSPTMAMAGGVTVVEVEELLEVGALDPETIVTPGIFVDIIVPLERSVARG
jgi:3-oxoadipate CoA-transferase alpha subunit